MAFLGHQSLCLGFRFRATLSEFARIVGLATASKPPVRWLWQKTQNGIPPSVQSSGRPSGSIASFRPSGSCIRQAARGHPSCSSGREPISIWVLPPCDQRDLTEADGGRHLSLVLDSLGMNTRGYWAWPSTISRTVPSGSKKKAMRTSSSGICRGRRRNSTPAESRLGETLSTLATLKPTCRKPRTVSSSFHALAGHLEVPEAPRTPSRSPVQHGRRRGPSPRLPSALYRSRGRATDP